MLPIMVVRFANVHVDCATREGTTDDELGMIAWESQRSLKAG